MQTCKKLSNKLQKSPSMTLNLPTDKCVLQKKIEPRRNALLPETQTDYFEGLKCKLESVICMQYNRKHHFV